MVETVAAATKIGGHQPCEAREDTCGQAFIARLSKTVCHL